MSQDNNQNQPGYQAGWLAALAELRDLCTRLKAGAEERGMYAVALTYNGLLVTIEEMEERKPGK